MSSSLAGAGRSMLRGGLASGVTGTTSAPEESAADRNPFVLPSDEDVFRLREVERKRKDDVRIANQGKKIWEKTDYSSTLTRTRKMIETMAPDVDPVALKKARESRGLVTAATAAIQRERRHDSETMEEFIAKKREMFLVQMSLDIKREEIAKLEHKAAQKEEALKKSELMLEEDAIRFDAFLKENDQQAHDAMKRAEAQTKLKVDKANELKKLRHAIGLVTAERTKLKETLDDYQRYKEFLDSLTPEEWSSEQVRKRLEAADDKRIARYQEKLEAWNEGRAEKEAELTAAVEAERRQALRQGKAPPRVDIASLVAASLPPPPELEDEPPVIEEEGEGGEVPMYFTRPQQLLDLFSQLEEDNLFLIQNCQDTEQQLEELRQQYAETSAAMARQSAVLDDNMAALHSQLMVEEAKAASLRKKIGESAGTAPGAGTTGGGGGLAGTITSTGAPSGTAASGGAGGGAPSGSAPGTAMSAGGGAAKSSSSSKDFAAMEAMLPELRAHIVEVYERCGFKATASSDTISMLTQLEGKLESLIAQLAGMDPEYVGAKEKEKERERRVRVREARLSAQQESHETRLKKMLERAQAPVKKREGKPVMFRSAPFERRVVLSKPDPALEQEKEDLKFWN